MLARKTWGGGWLAQKGFVDFAGSMVVHGVGGFSSLTLAFLLGPRTIIRSIRMGYNESKFCKTKTCARIKPIVLVFGELSAVQNESV